MSVLYKFDITLPFNFGVILIYMKKLFAIILLLTACRVKVPAQGYSEKDFKSLHALAGLWKMETGRGTIYEEWKITGNNKLSGRSFRVNNTDTMVFEKLEIYLHDGKIIYSPVVRNQNNGQAVPFALVAVNDKQYVFENKEHDYPQRIIYNLVSEDSVHARIEGTRNGQERGSDFKYSRVN